MSQLPRPTDAAPPAGEPPAADDALHPCVVLVVDDSDDDRQMVISYLRRFDPLRALTIIEAAAVEEGLQLLGRVQVGLVLLDHALPDGTGNEFLGRALADTDGQRLPIIMLTGRGSEHIAVDAMRRGACDYLSKGELGPDTLFRAILRAQKMRELALALAESSHARDVAQMALLRGEVTLGGLLNSIGDYAIVGLDCYGHVLSWNLGARGLFDYHDQDIIGSHLRVFDPDEGASISDSGAGGSLLASLEAAGRAGHAHGPRHFRRRDGGRFWGNSSLSAIRAAGGQLQGFAWVVHALPEGAAPAAGSGR